MSKFKTYLKAILIPIIVGVVAGFLSAGAIKYSSLIKPSFSPPAVLFPIVWTILYTLMGISYGILDSNMLVNYKINRIYYSQLIVNAFWSFFFFILDWRFFSFLWIVLLIVLVLSMIDRFYKKNKTAGLLQIPYLLWIIFAAVLNFSIYLLNR